MYAMNLVIYACLLGLFLALMSTSDSFAQSFNSTEQITLTGDLANNPVAQDILKKIEQTKKWIKELEERNYEAIEDKQELEAKRAQALEMLNKDLKEWETLWDYYSPRNSFSRFVDSVQDSQVKEVFWDQFEFHQIKVDAGRTALKKVLKDGGSLGEALQAYRKAAETKRIELIEANSMFNVNHNLAYYNQQILFNSEGQYIETPVTREHLQKYYQDFRTNPAYLQANPDDAVSWDELGQTNPNTECRKDMVVVYRFHANDYVCVSMLTAEMWIRHGMGEINGHSEVQSDTNSVTPLTKCDDGFIVVYALESKKYSCVLQETADSWINQGIAEIHDPRSFIADKIQDKSTSVTILGINQQLEGFENEFAIQQADLKKIFDLKYADALTKSKEDEKSAIKDLNDNKVSKEDTSSKIMKIRHDYDLTQASLLEEKMASLEKLEGEHKEKLKKFADSFEFDPHIKIVWDSELSRYNAVMKD
jgi:hypothetical protein